MLNRSVLIDGKIYGQHEVVLITHNVGIGETVVTVESSDGTESVSRSTSLALADGLTIAEAEAFMWSLDKYAEYVDESAGLLNEVLGILTDEQAETVPQAFPEWAAGVAYAVGDRRRDGALLYRCVQAHTSQEGLEPPTVPALWVRTSTDEWPEWVQPTGAHDAYGVGDRVTHGGSRWVSTVDANTWEPGVYGWNQA